MTAFVEVVFDNSDGRFLNQKDELVLRRTIGQKKDEYSLDRKSATKQDVQSMLEGAGFSRSNPYYIVPQGRVTALTNMKDPDRLNLLKEVAGTQVYEDRRQQSKRIMDDTHSKLEKIDDLLAFIRDRLRELEDEKEELKDFQQRDREKRCLEYTIYSRDHQNLQAKLDHYKEVQEQAEANTEQNTNAFAEGEEALLALEAQLAELQQRITVLELEKTQHQDERDTAVRDKTRIELDLDALREGHQAAQQAETRHKKEMRDVEKLIAQREKELASIMPTYDTNKAAELDANRKLTEADGQRQRLFAKQGRQAAYTSKAERDNWLSAQINDVNMALSKRKAVTLQTSEEITETESDISRLQSEIDDLRHRLDNRGTHTQEIAADLQKATDERDRLQDKRRELRRQEAKLSSNIDHVRREMQKAEQGLSQMMDRNTSQGIAAVRRIKQEHNIQGVYGTLAELFTAESEAYKTAIEVTAGNSLFHFVVDTDETAQQVLEIMQRKRAGRVTFVPLNRVKPRAANLPRANDARPLIEKLKYDARYEPAMRQVFGRTVLCPNLQIASQYARSHGIEAITADGDRADKKGALTGGFHDSRRSRMDAIKNLSKWRQEFEELDSSLTSVTQECDRLDQLVTKAISDVQKAEHRQRQANDGHGPLLVELRGKTTELQTKQDEVEAKKRTKDNVEAAVRQLGEQSSAYEAELASEFKHALTPAEDRELQSLSKTVQELRKSASDATAKTSELELQKTTIEVELRENLRMRLDQLKADESELGSSSQTGGQDSRRLAEQERALQRVEQLLAESIAHFDESVAKATQLQSEHDKLKRTFEEQQKAQIELSVTTRRDQKHIEKSAGKLAMYRVQEAEVATKIRNLGALPDAANQAEYKKMQYEVAIKRFHKVKEDLKKYGNVNKKAFEQYNQFTRQRESLETRREELITSQSSILDLIDTLDQRKDEAIERTFRQVSREFATIFERLVPAGRGSLKIQRRVDAPPADENDDDTGDEEERARQRRSGVDNYTGVSIQVSFNSKHDEQQKIQQLSGGQKSESLKLPFLFRDTDMYRSLRSRTRLCNPSIRPSPLLSL